MDFASLETLVKDNPDALAFVKEFGPKLAKLPELESQVAKIAELQPKAELAAKYEKDIENLKAVNADFEKQKDKWKSGKSGTEAEYNALKEQIAANEALTKTIQDKLIAAEEKAKVSDAAKMETDLKSLVITTGVKLKGRNPDDDYILLKAKGLVGYDAEGKPFFNKLNDKNEPVKLNNIDELMTWYYEKDLTRVGASGIPGAGGKHTGGGAEGAGAPATRQEARAAFQATRGV